MAALRGPAQPLLCFPPESCRFWVFLRNGVMRHVVLCGGWGSGSTLHCFLSAKNIPVCGALVSLGCLAESRGLGEACRTEMSFLAVVEAGSVRSRCQQVWFLAVFAHGCLSPACVLIASYRAPVRLDLGPTCMTSFHGKHLFKGPVSKYSHILKSRGWNPSIGDFSGHSSAHDMWAALLVN